MIWNPQDEKCIDVRIVLMDSEDNSFRISGIIFSKIDSGYTDS